MLLDPQGFGFVASGASTSPTGILGSLIEKRIETLERRVEGLEADVKQIRASMDSLRDMIIARLVEALARKS